MKKLICVISIICLISGSDISIAQKEPNIWYFGDSAGIDFNQSPPVALTDGVINPPPVGIAPSSEGCASIADKSTGKLLFYTNGETVWNSTHTPMPNGTGLFGHFSATQSAVIVGMPGDATKYYIFTADITNVVIPKGIHYSIVDMTLNGGLGDITVKNIFLFKPATEKLTAIHHSNCTDIWVIAHQWDSDAFYAYLVSDAGIASPIISKVGSLHWDGGNGFDNETLGQLKVAPNGKKLALAIYNDNSIPENDVELFDFDNTTGIISNAVYLPTISKAYGISFSPDNSKLYVSFAVIGNGELWQYDLLAGGGDPNAIRASKTVIFTSSSSAYYPLQMAPDGKIYLARASNYLGVINNPNAAGLACNFIEDGFDLNGQSSQASLPGFIESYFDTTTISIIIISITSNTSICLGDSVQLVAGGGTNYSWSPSTGLSNTTIANPMANPTTTTNYTVTVSVSCSSDTASMLITVQECDSSSIFFIPNSFSPNGDGVNDILFVRGSEIKSIKLSIYNRWGEKVFGTYNINTGWDGNYRGKPLNSGVFSWYAEMEFEDANNPGQIYRKGNVTLVR